MVPVLSHCEEHEQKVEEQNRQNEFACIRHFVRRRTVVLRSVHGDRRNGDLPQYAITQLLWETQHFSPYVHFLSHRGSSFFGIRGSESKEISP